MAFHEFLLHLLELTLERRCIRFRLCKIFRHLFKFQIHFAHLLIMHRLKTSQPLLHLIRYTQLFRGRFRFIRWLLFLLLIVFRIFRGRFLFLHRFFRGSFFRGRFLFLHRFFRGSFFRGRFLFLLLDIRAFTIGSLHRIIFRCRLLLFLHRFFRGSFFRGRTVFVFFRRFSHFIDFINGFLLFVFRFHL